MPPSYTSLISGSLVSVANMSFARGLNIHPSQTPIFVPIGIEATGAFGKPVYQFLLDLQKHLKLETWDLFSHFFLQQRIKVVVQRDNTATVHYCFHVAI